MIVFRHADPRFPFLLEGHQAACPPGRWNAAGELTHYFCDTPDGAWAEFLRHEEITDPQDLGTVRRALWAVEIDAPPPREFFAAGQDQRALGGPDTWPACRQWARSIRNQGEEGFVAPSAALYPGGAHGWRVDSGLQAGPSRDSRVYALFGPRPDLVGWPAAMEGRPSSELLARVRHF